MSLFHRDIFMPEAVDTYCGRLLKLVWARHAKCEWIDEKIPGEFHPPMNMVINREHIVEAEIDRAGVLKLVVRFTIGHNLDLILVIYLDGTRSERAVVGSCWTNKSDDTHETLYRSKYAKS